MAIPLATCNRCGQDVILCRCTFAESINYQQGQSVIECLAKISHSLEGILQLLVMEYKDAHKEEVEKMLKEKGEDDSED